MLTTEIFMHTPKIQAYYSSIVASDQYAFGPCHDGEGVIVSVGVYLCMPVAQKRKNC